MWMDLAVPCGCWRALSYLDLEFFLVFFLLSQNTHSQAIVPEVFIYLNYNYIYCFLFRKIVNIIANNGCTFHQNATFGNS